MRPIIPDLLWIGNALDLRDVKAVLSLGIRAVIDLAANEPATQYPRDIAYCRLPLNDGAENEPAILGLAVSSTVAFVKARVPTLVACSAGMSRSLAVVAAALADVDEQSPDEVLLRIATSSPHDVAPGLWSDVKRLVAARDGWFELPSGRRVLLQRLHVRESEYGFLLGKPELIRKHVLDDLPAEIERLFGSADGLIIEEPHPGPLPRYVLVADFTSFSPVKEGADCSGLVLCWFAQGLEAASAEKIGENIRKVDWDAHARDGYW